MQNIKIATRLILLSALLILGSVILGLVGWSTLNNVSATASTALQYAEDGERAVDVARKAQVDFKIQIQEWKNTLLRGGDRAVFEKYKTAFVKSGDETQAGLVELAIIFKKLKLDTAQVDDARQSLKQLTDKYVTALGQYEAAGADGAKTVDALVRGMDREPTAKIDKIVEFVNANTEQMRADSRAALAEQAKTASTTMMIALAILTLVGIALTYWIITSVIRPLNRAIGIARTVAAGDLTTNIEVKTTDETGQLLHALKDMNENLVRIVSRVRNGTDAIATGSNQIAAGNLDLSSRTEEQASALEETASSMEEITSTVKQNAANATQANQFAASASDVAHRGRDVVAQVVTTMDSINEASRKVVDIIGVIDGIAFQTNILALNAAVEAARAGEQGRGFAVVAAEVRTLAQRSASAAKEIKALIGDSVERVEAGGQYVAEAGTTMDEIMESIQRVATIMNEITLASREQSAGIEQVNQAIGQMDEVTQQNAALVEEAAAAAASLQQQAEQLTETVSAFKLAA